MKNLSLFFLVFCLFLSNSSFAKKQSGNGWVSSGGDEIPESQVWFVGDKKIAACLQRSPDYSKREDELIFSIHKASNIWKEYFNTKIQTKFQSNFRPQFDFDFKPCSETTEVVFYFGVRNSDVELAMKRFKNPKAFSILKDYDPQTMRGDGFLWFDDLNKYDSVLNQEALTALIVHELGHVYGVGHVQGTIMDENIVDMLFSSGVNGGWATNDPYMTRKIVQIDQRRPLFFSHMDKFSYQGHVPYNFHNPNTIMAKQIEILTDLMGRKPIGDVRAEFKNLGIIDGRFINYRLILKDFIGTVEVKLDMYSDGTQVRGPKIFKILGSLENGMEVNEYVNSTYYEIFGSINTSNQKTYSTIYTLNMGDYYPVRIRVLEKGVTYNLFVEGEPRSTNL